MKTSPANATLRPIACAAPAQPGLSRRSLLSGASSALVTATAGLLSGRAIAAPTTTKFPASVIVQGVPLQLNGAGTRFKAIFKVYDMAMYTARKAGTAEEALRLTSPVLLSFVALREVSGTELGRLFLRGMADNSPRDVVSRHAVSSNRLIEIFSGRSKLVAGDTFAMEFAPGKGTGFFIADQPQGAPVGDTEFFRMVLSIWLGPVPADHLLKDGLLGIDKG